MKDDCARITARIGEAHETNSLRKKENAARTVKGWGLMATSWLVLCIFFYVGVLETCAFGPVATAVREHVLPRVEGQAVVKEIVEGLLPGRPDGEGNPAPARWFGIPHAGAYVMGFLLVAYFVLRYVQSVVWRLAPVMSKKEIKRLGSYLAYVKELSKIREELYKEYFKQLHNSHD